MDFSKNYENTLPSILTTTHIEPLLYKQLLTPELQKKKPYYNIDNSKTGNKVFSSSPIDQNTRTNFKENTMMRQLTNPKLKKFNMTNIKVKKADFRDYEKVKKLNKSVNFATEIDNKKSKSQQHIEIFDKPILENLPKISIINFLDCEIHSNNSRNTQNQTNNNFKSFDSKQNLKETTANSIVKNNNNTSKIFKKINNTMQNTNKGYYINFRKLKFFQDIINK